MTGKSVPCRVPGLEVCEHLLHLSVVAKQRAVVVYYPPQEVIAQLWVSGDGKELHET